MVFLVSMYYLVYNKQKSTEAAMNSKIKLSEKTYILLFWAIMVIGISARVWRFGSVPGGLNQDEAFAGYEAWSLLHYGIDSA